MNPAQAAYSKTAMFLDAIRFQESMFALPFAYTGMILAADGFPSLRVFILITVAMVTARTVGMAANRIIDRHIDARNPRNAERHLPAGKIKAADMVVLTVISGVIFLVAAWLLNPLAFMLAPVAIAYMLFYPFTKRFTWAANLLLGWVLAISPSAAWIGVTGELPLQPVLLSLAVALWAGSFDILYHTQDRSFYVQDGLHSFAERFGVRRAFVAARSLDFLALCCLVGLGVWITLAWPYFLGLAVVAAILIYKHTLVSPDDMSKFGIAFFRINAYVSTSVFVGTLIAVLI